MGIKDDNQSIIDKIDHITDKVVEEAQEYAEIVSEQVQKEGVGHVSDIIASEVCEAVEETILDNLPEISHDAVRFRIDLFTDKAKDYVSDVIEEESKDIITETSKIEIRSLGSNPFGDGTIDSVPVDAKVVEGESLKKINVETK